MRKSALVVLALFAAVPAPAVGKTGLCERAYVARVKAAHHVGSHALGRNICRHGIKQRIRAGATRTRDATTKEKYLYLVQLRNLARPAPFALARQPVRPRRAPAGVMSWVYIPTGVAACIVHSESRGNPRATNGQYHGLAQWSPEAWARHGGHRYASDPLYATQQQQLLILSNGLKNWGCRDWCPFDGCG